MWRWALLFFVVAVLAYLIGFTGIAATVASYAKTTFFVILLLFVIVIVWKVTRRPPKA
jgi:uncharacterized membrane protein YtjA (UPF0391 family)